MLLKRGCPGCGELLAGVVRTRHCVICADCLGRGRPVGEIRGLAGLDRCGALFQYRSQIQRAVLAGKYGARRDGLGHFGILLGQLADQLEFRFEVVTWVPASRSGARQRGYDQGRLLATALGRHVGVPVRRMLAPGRTAGTGADLAMVSGRGDGYSGPDRSGRRRGQTGRGRTARLAGPSLRTVRPAPGRVLIVDDVITTGATVNAAANALRQAGAATVLGMVVAWTASDREVAAGRPLTALDRWGSADRKGLPEGLR